MVILSVVEGRIIFCFRPSNWSSTPLRLTKLVLKLITLDQTTMSLIQGKTKKNGHPERSRRTDYFLFSTINWSSTPLRLTTLVLKLMHWTKPQCH